MWPRFLLKCFVIALYTLAAFGCGILLSLLLARPASAREPVQYHCQGYIYPRMWCEAKYVYPFVPKWSLYLKGTRVEYEDGIYVYLTVSDEWERAEACILDHCVTFYVRWHEGELQFGEKQ